MNRQALWMLWFRDISYWRCLKCKRAWACPFCWWDMTWDSWPSSRIASVSCMRGKLMEVGPVDRIFKNPLHPYTQLLIACPPTLKEKGAFRGIPGLPPILSDLPSGCVFHPRCPRCKKECPVEIPELIETEPGHWVACQEQQEEHR